jgi:hemolysin activation/secretion protein
MAGAQALPRGVPQSVQPGRVLQQPIPAPPPSGPGGGIALPAPVEGAPPAGAENLRFQLTDVAVTGATTYPAAAFRPVFEKDIGKTVSLADVYRWAAEITETYRRDGYVLSQVVVPEQRIQGGVVHLVVAEGFVDQVIVKGVSSPRLKALGDHIRSQHPLKAATLERYLLLANDLPGMSVQGVLSPSQTTPGAADLTLTARRKQVDGSVETDNFGTAYQGPWEATASVGANGLLGQDERLALRYTTVATPSELGLVGADLALPLGSDGTQLVIDASHTQGRPGFTLSPFDVHTVGDSVSLGLQHALIRSRASNLTVAATLVLSGLHHHAQYPRLVGRQGPGPAPQRRLQPDRPVRRQ